MKTLIGIIVVVAVCTVHFFDTVCKRKDSIRTVGIVTPGSRFQYKYYTSDTTHFVYENRGRYYEVLTVCYE
jgi:hypothetical protein